MAEFSAAQMMSCLGSVFKQQLMQSGITVTAVTVVDTCYRVYLIAAGKLAPAVWVGLLE